jgi:hypothetical protein
MDELIKTKLSSKKDNLDLRLVLEFMESTDIWFRDEELRGPFGITTNTCIYLDVDKLISHFNNKMIAYIILHEIGHYKRIIKMGVDTMISNLSSEVFDDLHAHIIDEEITADRYSAFVYYQLYGEQLPQQMTQALHIASNRSRYEQSSIKLFGVIDNKLENYEKLIRSFVV